MLAEMAATKDKVKRLPARQGVDAGAARSGGRDRPEHGRADRERRAGKPAPRTLGKLAAALGVTPTDLLPDED